MNKKQFAFGVNLKQWNIGFEVIEPKGLTILKINLLCFEIMFAKWKGE